MMAMDDDHAEEVGTMNSDGQTDAISFLTDPATHGVAGPVEAMETHISRIFLVGKRAYKMKRAIRLPYADFTTPELRLATCRKEVELNAETAPELYLGARRLTRKADGTLEFDGAGELIEAVVEMERFEQSALFDRMAADGKLTPELMTETAREILKSHRVAPIVHSGSGAANIEGVLDINRAGFATSQVFSASEVEALDARSRSVLTEKTSLLDARETAGKVRRCHGDLHLRNICLLVANCYLDEADDESGFILLPFFMAIRATVRAHVTATQATEGDRADILATEARSYFDLASNLLAERPVWLVAIGGLSGSGKTTIAEALAAHVGAPPGARIVESDRVRKVMHGVTPETRLPETAYRPEVSHRVYREMAWRANLNLAAGGSVVADAVFDRMVDRNRIEHVAESHGLPFQGIWLEAAPDLLWRRVERRKGGPSDATVDVLERQLQRGMGATTWRRLNAARPPQDVVFEILSKMESRKQTAGKIDTSACCDRG